MIVLGSNEFQIVGGALGRGGVGARTPFSPCSQPWCRLFDCLGHVALHVERQVVGAGEGTFAHLKDGKKHRRVRGWVLNGVLLKKKYK